MAGSHVGLAFSLRSIAAGCEDKPDVTLHAA
eukprot:COSAG06_NODE_23207_length_699_cov_1.868333_2_plen_31_part_01